MGKTETMTALENLNSEWREKGRSHAVPKGDGWTMSCPSCRMAVEEQTTLVDALNRALVHRRKNCTTIPDEG